VELEEMMNHGVKMSRTLAAVSILLALSCVARAQPESPPRGEMYAFVGI